MSNSPPTSTAVGSTPPNTEDTASTVTVSTKAPAPNFPTKTDKPRPHVCQTCQRSFARLEHLKRHERSHTKEKPFECPECTRCFARRDLLLRHQQKLHQTTTPASRPRNRRESVSSVAGGSRARKNSMAGGVSGAPGVGNAGMRPRANTISHIDGQAMQNLIASNVNPAAAARLPPTYSHSRHPSLAGLPMHGSFDQQMFAGMSAVLGHRGMSTGLPKLETRGIDMDFNNNGLPTAPVFSPEFMSGSEIDPLGFGNSTINPNALHFSDSPQSMALDSTTSPFSHGMADMGSANPHFEDDFNWLRGGFEQQMTFNSNHESAIDGSSPSAISTNSQSVSDPMVDGSTHPGVAAHATTSMWQPSIMGHAPAHLGGWDMGVGGTGFPDLMGGAPISPQPNSQKSLNDAFFSTPPTSLNALSPSVVAGLTTQSMNQAMSFPAGPETPTSLNGNNSASPVSTFTDATRNALQSALSQCSSFRGRKYSFPIPQSPLSPRYQPSTNTPDPVKSLPSTKDLQRYLAAYIRFFQPHLPFMHLPTLSFELPADPTSGLPNAAGGSGSLVFSMAAIGALYERELTQSQELFENAKAMIKIYLEERRKENVKRADFRLTPVSEQSATQAPEGSNQTPLWLVQAMLLNIIYGHNSADKAIGESSYNHCNALVSLARAANILTPRSPDPRHGHDQLMGGGIPGWGVNGQSEADEHAEWLRWKANEERKRTLFTIYIVQSLLISAYNHQPVLTHSEITLDLPCEEEFFTAENSAIFGSIGGVVGASADRCSFRETLDNLMGANKRFDQQQMNAGFELAGTSMGSDLKLSTFGCVVMIHALHNTLWEHRQVHYNKTWTNEETENLHHHMEPALQAWRAAYDRHPNHGPQRPNTFGPLAANCIPLFDLACLRLHVNLCRSKELFWARDWTGLANELRCGHEIVQHAEHSPRSAADGTSNGSPHTQSSNSTYESPNQAGSEFPSSKFAQHSESDNKSVSRRERQLRKAAYCAAESLLNAARTGTTFADFTSRELPLTSALSVFDCSQVLAEWVATLQDRTGPYLGILGQSDVDFSQLPAVIFLEEEDIKLIRKIEEIVGTARTKLRGDTARVNAMDHRLQEHVGYAAQILAVTSLMFERASVWPVTRLMARCLESHAENMKMRSGRVLRHE
ncbi:hypothetical protein MKZ38_004538 [Zalerion maritima]|uniref:C2H2-type domain-containing protein n=1 Tax=Zalerion maritima TaxID=339359 RepID=A0AAD5RM89_9PEZI|nr:hypothetical protein MKZ38_004538 [Zalerion maritima]